MPLHELIPIIGRKQRQADTLSRFTILNSNVSLAQARVIAIAGQDHYSPDVAHFGRLIRAFAKRGDIVLFESYSREKRIPHKTPEVKDAQIPRKVRIYGWEDMNTRNLAMVFASHTFSLLHKVTTLEQGIRRLRKRAHSSIEEGHADQAKQEIDALRQLQSKIARYLKAQEILDQRTDEITVIHRNQELIDSISLFTQRFPNKRIFIIAGQGHFFDPNSQNVQQKLQEYPFALISLNHTTPSTYVDKLTDTPESAEAFYRESLGQYRRTRSTRFHFTPPPA